MFRRCISLSVQKLGQQCQFSLCPSTMNITLSDHDLSIIQSVKGIVPNLDSDHHKGQHGRIGIIGGSAEYTGAPYFAGISALRVGADLVHIFCAKDAAQPIKSYSPDLIVHPILDHPDAVEAIVMWMERLHVIVIGPGLGQDPPVLHTVKELLKRPEMKGKRLVIDADGLKLFEHIKSIEGLSGIITPNAIEYQRLNGSNSDQFVVLAKGTTDLIFDEGRKLTQGARFMGSGRRCGGQGDLLSGAIATLYHWATECPTLSADINRKVLACQGASLLVRLCNAHAFAIRGRGTLAYDMIEHIPTVFKEYFEPSN